MVNSAFERNRKPFHIFGREFYFQYIPSIHFQDAMRQVLEILTELDFAGSEFNLKESPPSEPPNSSGRENICGDNDSAIQRSRLFGKLRIILEEKIYQILYDVLLYQNDERVEIDLLKHKTSPLEIATFLHLLLSDEEIVRSLEVVTASLGKLFDNLTQIPSATPNSTPSS